MLGLLQVGGEAYDGEGSHLRQSNQWRERRAQSAGDERTGQRSPAPDRSLHVHMSSISVVHSSRLQFPLQVVIILKRELRSSLIADVARLLCSVLECSPRFLSAFKEFTICLLHNHKHALTSMDGSG